MYYPILFMLPLLVMSIVLIRNGDRNPKTAFSNVCLMMFVAMALVALANGRVLDLTGISLTIYLISVAVLLISIFAVIESGDMYKLRVTATIALSFVLAFLVIFAKEWIYFIRWGYLPW